MADLAGAILIGADLSDAELSEAHLQYAHLEAPVPNDEAYDTLADLQRTDLSQAHLRGALLFGANLSNVSLTGADLRGTSLGGANLSGADLEEAVLERALLGEANLTGAVYEPKQNPAPAEIASAKGLDSLKWYHNSAPLVTLRKSLVEAGFDTAARQVTASIRRHDQSPLEYLLFDWTCEWGAKWWRPLGVAGVLSLICTIVYWIGMHFGGRSGIYLIATGQAVTTSKGKERSRKIRIRPPHDIPKPSEQLDLNFAPECEIAAKPKSFKRLLWTELRGLGTAWLFSMMSLFNISFREFTFGSWIRLLQPRDFNLRARGWMRVMSGAQSLLGAGLVVLALLSYFGHPFD